MVDEKTESRELNLRQMFSWTELLHSFWVAFDPKKLLLAAAGILVMSLGWWLLSIIFDYKEPTKSDFSQSEYAKKYGEGPEAAARLESDLKSAQEKWKLTNKAANKKDGTLRTLPWDEDRGPNPYLLVTGQAENLWERGQYWDWFFKTEVPWLIEPLRKFLLPVIYFLQPTRGFLNTLYFPLAMLVTVATWALFGGAITRMAVVEVARKEKIGMMEALRFTINRYRSFLTAPLFPFLFALILTLLMILFGFIHLIPILGDVFDGLLWLLPLLAGLVMAVLLVGLVGWPLMSATISAEGTDAWEAVSRSYSYVYQAPWHFLWYCIVAVVYGAVLMFFVGFMGSLTIYLAKWGVSQTPFVESANRDPSFLFVWAPKSFGWRELLVQGAKVEVEEDGVKRVKTVMVNRPVTDKNTEISYDDYLTTFKTWNYIGAALVMLWLMLIFLLILGFGYSYFWTAGSIIYLLMRKKVDDAELDEVYLEEEDQDTLYRDSSLPAAPLPPEPAPAAPPLQQLGMPSLRPAPKTEAPPAPGPSTVGATPTSESPGAASPPVAPPHFTPPESPPPAGSDGNPPAGGGS